jgi:exodeoxyribonuclease VII large subunit
VAGIGGRVAALRHRLAIAGHRAIERRGDVVGRLAAQLSPLNPDAVLARGYSITRHEDGRIVRADSEVAAGDRLSLTFAEGGAQVRVEENSRP